VSSERKLSHSISARRFSGASPYAGAKAAVQGLTKVLAAELGAKDIRVNCVLPGAIPTEINQRAGLGTTAELEARMHALAPLHALGRIGTAEEVAEAIAYLLPPSGLRARCSMSMGVWASG